MWRRLCGGVYVGHARTLPFVDTDGKPFRFTNIDRIQEMVHRID